MLLQPLGYIVFWDYGVPCSFFSRNAKCPLNFGEFLRSCNRPCSPVEGYWASKIRVLIAQAKDLEFSGLGF